MNKAKALMEKAERYEKENKARRKELFQELNELMNGNGAGDKKEDDFFTMDEYIANALQPQRKMIDDVDGNFIRKVWRWPGDITFHRIATTLKKAFKL